MIMVGTAAMVVGYVWLSQISATDSYFGAVFGPVLITGPRDRLHLHADHRDRARRRRAGARRVGLGPAADHPAARQRRRRGRDRLGVRRPARCPGQFVPGVEAAFLTSAAFSLAAFVVAATGAAHPRVRRSRSTEELEPELAEAA